ncbi:RHS repeat-associated core domain-containing protein, partial [Photobacterium aquae]
LQQQQRLHPHRAEYQRDYRYNAADQLVGIEDSEQGASQYQFDVLDQLTSSQLPHQPEILFAFDSFGNPQNTAGEGADSAVCVTQDRLEQWHDTHYRYDGFGNQVKTCSQQGNEQRRFNGLNQLTSFRKSGKYTQYHYDALGRRSAKISESQRIDYLWDGDQLIGEHCNGEYRWYLYELGSFKPVALIALGEIYYYQLDHLGTPLALTDQHGDIAWQADYSTEGVASLTIERITNPLRFQGQYYDVESGLHYNRFRYYDPTVGRFIHQDPIGLLGGINPYQYAPNPVQWVDPLGLSCKEGDLLGELDPNRFVPNSLQWVDPLELSCNDGKNIFESANQYLVDNRAGIANAVNKLSRVSPAGVFGIGAGYESILGLSEFLLDPYGNISNTFNSAKGLASDLFDAQFKGDIEAKIRLGETGLAMWEGGKKWASETIDHAITGDMFELGANTGSHVIDLATGVKAGLKLSTLKVPHGTASMNGVGAFGSTAFKVMKKLKLPCFKPGDALKKSFKNDREGLAAEFDKQLKNQQDGINKMTVGKYLENRERLAELVKIHGSKKARQILTNNGSAQRKARDDYFEKLKKIATKEYRGQGISSVEAERLALEKAKNTMKDLAALHDPDLIAGGDDKITGFGDKRVNSSLGSQWPKTGIDPSLDNQLPRQSRVTSMDAAARNALSNLGADAKMNVELTRCK